MTSVGVVVVIVAASVALAFVAVHDDVFAVVVAAFVEVGLDCVRDYHTVDWI